MNGNDLLLARDLASDTTIHCDGGGAPGGADEAELDPLPNDPELRGHGLRGGGKRDEAHDHPFEGAWRSPPWPAWR